MYDDGSNISQGIHDLSTPLIHPIWTSFSSPSGLVKCLWTITLINNDILYHPLIHSLLISLFCFSGLVKCSVELDTLDNVNAVFDKLREGKINGRIVIKMD